MRREQVQAVAEAIRRARTERGLTQEEMAERLKVSREHYNRLERAVSRPSVDMLVKLGALLGISVDDALAGDGHPVASEPILEPKPELRRLVELARGLDPASLDLLLRLAKRLARKK
jgi:transcriptional regulator with XRE-family HTH domain